MPQATSSVQHADSAAILWHPHCLHAFSAVALCDADPDIQGESGSLEVYQFPWSFSDDCADLSQHCSAAKVSQEVHATCQD